MTNAWGRPPEEPEPRRPAAGRRALIAGAAVVVIAAAAVGGWFYRRDDGDDGGNAVAEPVFTEDAAGTSTEAESPESKESAANTENTVTPVTVPAEPETSAAPAAEPASGSGRSGGTTCDGRGVLIVNSVFSDSHIFQQEIDTALAEHPGSKVLGPGTCPSLRAHKDGADVYAVVVDYGDDLPGLCSAAAAGRGNARLLNDDTSYNSPC
jgi:hypothetical protein